MNPLAEIYDFLDGTLREVLSRPGNQSSCCSKGCFHCCREPAYATRKQVRYLLESVPPDQLPELKAKVEAWLIKFRAGPWIFKDRPNAFAYRAEYLWCPLLAKDGTCSVYDRRPMECRLFFATGKPEYCADDALRRQQRFGDVPVVVEMVMRRVVLQMEPGEKDTYDHIGIMLAEELFGREFPTASRMDIIRESNGELTMHKYEPIDVDKGVDKL